MGAGLFGLIMSMMPPKARKLMSWVGFTSTDREGALKLLTISASAGQDVHSAFAALTLLTFYSLILLLSGWQADEQYLFDHCASMLNRVIARFPTGTLWRLNLAKLARYQRKPDEAIDIIESALAAGTSFREADSLLVFELAWLYLSKANYIKTADNFERMCDMNKWSLATYVAIAAGALIDEVNTRGATPKSPNDSTDFSSDYRLISNKRRPLANLLSLNYSSRGGWKRIKRNGRDGSKRVNFRRVRNFGK